MLDAKNYKKRSGLVQRLKFILQIENKNNIVYKQSKFLLDNINNYTIEELVIEMNKITKICDICGFEYCYFDENCPKDQTKHVGGSNFKLLKNFEDLDEFELKHYEYKDDHLKRATLATAIGLRLNNKNIDKNLKLELEKINPLDRSKTYEEWLDIYNNIYTICPIYGDKITLQDEKCKNLAVIPDNTPHHWHEKPDEECNELELKHKFFRLDTIKKESLPKAIKNKLNNKNILPETKKFLENFDCYNPDKTYEELKNELSKVILYYCEICGQPVYFWDGTCRYIGIIKGNQIENNNTNAKYIEKADNECNEYELLHKKYRFNIRSKILTEICYTLFSKQYCPVCKQITTFSISLGGCMSCYNKSPEMRKASSERMYARWNDPVEATIMMAHLLKINEEQGLEQKLDNLRRGNETQAWLYENDPEWRAAKDERMRKMIAISTWLMNNDKEYYDRMCKIASRNRKITVAKKEGKLLDDPIYTQEKINEANLFLQEMNVFLFKNIKDRINSSKFKVNSKRINYKEIKKLMKNDICGAYVIKAKFKHYQNNEKYKDLENKVFDTLVCKSINVYSEIYWVQSVIANPEKQNRWITKDNTWTYAKWWYIANLYYDFEFELITDENGVSEQEAFDAEASYAITSNLLVEFNYDEYSRKIPIIEKHAYWSY